ncbi:MAG: thermonuclease family protein [SAR324 cluster bacterium]|nr:thermonuclease family protein [SAR324 cluster bacterium]
MKVPKTFNCLTYYDLFFVLKATLLVKNILVYNFRLSTLTGIFIIISLAFLSGCGGPELDSDGGYYNAKTGRYKFVRPSKKATRHSGLGLNLPVEGKIQQFSAQVVKIDESAKDIWVFIEDRRSYQMLAEQVTGLRRNDRDKHLKFSLRYIAPLASMAQRPKKRAQWKAFAIQVMEQELVGNKIIINFEHRRIPKKYLAEIFKIVQTDKGQRLRNFNRWMVYQGLSVYFFQDRKKKPEKEYLDAQRLAKKRKSGIWKYL